MKKSKIESILGIIVILLVLLTFLSPLLIMYYAEEQYFIDQYKKNKKAFENVKNELFLVLEENATELNLVVSYDREKGRILQNYNRTTYSVDADDFIDANSESYNAVNESFGDFSFSKIYVTHNYLCLSEEGNNYQYIYSADVKPDSAHYASRENDKIHALGDNWYLVTPN